MQSATESPTPTPTVTATVTVTATPSPQGWWGRNGDALSVTLVGVIGAALLGIVVRRLTRRKPASDPEELHLLLTQARSLFNGPLMDKPDYWRDYYTTTMQRLEPIHAEGIRDRTLKRLVGELLDQSRALWETAPGSVKDATPEEKARYQEGYGQCENLAKRALGRLAGLRSRT